jgi:cysteine desulfurase
LPGPINYIPPAFVIYLDNAASTAPAPQVLSALAEAAANLYANPSSAHGLGAAAARALESARAEVARLCGGQPAEIVFTSGGTEANALGTLGAAAAARGRHVIVGGIEHPAVLRSIASLQDHGFTVTTVAPGPDGVVPAAALAAALRPDTALVALMLVNNELGTLQPVPETAAALRAAGSRAHLHCDAVQAAGLVAVDVRALGVDSLALSAHKLHGPKGAGALWLRAGARLRPLWDGGRQEKALRSGTENLPAQVGFGVAARLAVEAGASATGAQVASWRDQLEALITALVPEARPTIAVNAPRAPHIASVTIPGLPAEVLLHALEARGIFASAGSACATRSKDRSHVLAAIGVPESAAVLRFSLSRQTAQDELPATAAALRAAIDEVAPMVRSRPARKAQTR